MPRFLLLLTPALRTREFVAPAELQRSTMAFMEWVAHGVNTGVIRSGARLERDAVRIARNDGMTTLLRSSATREPQTTSYFVVESENLDSAVALATSCPAADPGTIAVFQLDLTAAVGDAHGDIASVR